LTGKALAGTSIASSQSTSGKSFSISLPNWADAGVQSLALAVCSPQFLEEKINGWAVQVSAPAAWLPPVIQKLTEHLRGRDNSLTARAVQSMTKLSGREHGRTMRAADSDHRFRHENVAPDYARVWTLIHGTSRSRPEIAVKRTTQP
jgi:hypothetical protein